MTANTLIEDRELICSPERVKNNLNKLKVFEIPFYFDDSFILYDEDIKKRYKPTRPVFNRPGLYYIKSIWEAVAWVELPDGTARRYPDDSVRQLEWEMRAHELDGITREEATTLLKLYTAMSRTCRGKLFTKSMLRKLHNAKHTFYIDDIRSARGIHLDMKKCKQHGPIPPPQVEWTHGQGKET